MEINKRKWIIKRLKNKEEKVDVKKKVECLYSSGSTGPNLWTHCINEGTNDSPRLPSSLCGRRFDENIKGEGDGEEEERRTRIRKMRE